MPLPVNRISCSTDNRPLPRVRRGKPNGLQALLAQEGCKDAVCLTKSAVNLQIERLCFLRSTVLFASRPHVTYCRAEDTVTAADSMPETMIHPDYRGCRQTAQLTATERQTIEPDGSRHRT
jgi:hypothetical protein